jgi:hypothetical protein
MPIFDLGASPTDLWRGCVLSTIAHAIFIAHRPELANEQSWDDVNYNIQDTQGALGTVTFASEGVVAAFFDSHSSRNPAASNVPYKLSARLEEMPIVMQSVAEREAFQYLIQDLNGDEVPVVTAIFWQDGERLVAAEPWNDVRRHGAHVIENQIQPADIASTAWTSHYDLSPDQTELLRSLYARKLAAVKSPIVLAREEMSELLKRGSEGIEPSRELLAGIAITLP